MVTFSGVGTSQGVGSWYQEPTGATRTIRPDMVTVIGCAGAVNAALTPLAETDGLILTGGTNFNLTTPVNLNKLEFVNVGFTEADITQIGVAHTAGLAALTALIDMLPVGTKLILAGQSLGAAITSDIYDEIRTGTMTDRIPDLLAGITFGNPRRGTGVTFTDPTFGLCADPIPGGSGISSTPLTGTESKWWELAVPGDPVCCQLNTADHTNQAYWARQFFIAVMAGANIQTVLDAAAAEGGAQNAACLTAANSLLNLATSPHGNYHIAKPFVGLGDTRSYNQVGVDYINSFAAAAVMPTPVAHRLDSNEEPVGPGQVITAGADCMWYNLPTFAGSAIKISVDVFDDEDDLISNVTSPTTTITGSNNSAYQTLTGTFTMPDNAHHARLVYQVAAEVMTTGIVRFKNPVFTGGFAVVTPRRTATNPKLLALKDIMLHETDILSRAIAGDSIAEFTEFDHNKTWVITIHDFLWRPIGELGDDIMELTGIDPRNKVPTAKIKIKGDSQHIAAFKNCAQTMVGITIETGGQRQAFYVDVFDWEYSNAEWTGTAHLNGIWDVLNFLQVWPNFLFPIQVQIPSHAIFIGPIVSVVNTMVAECAFRIQTGLWEFVNNALSLNPDIRAWFGTLLQSNGNFFDMLKTPVYVSGVNPFLDTSPLVARTVRMESCGAVIEDITRAYGIDVRVDLWLPGDEQPDVWTQTFTFLQLNQPTYVVSSVDRSQIEGPTKTILDSVLRTIVDLLGSFFGDIGTLVQSVPGMQGVFESPLLGINFVAPWAIIIAPDIGDKGSVASCKLSYHTPKGWQHIIGGRSPKWLNDLMNALFGWILDAISILVGLIGIPSDLLSGLLNNAFLAFQLIEHYGRRNQVGPYHPAIEVMHPTPTAPYNIETIFGFINAFWDSRGYVSGQFTFRDGDVYKYGKDIFRGGLVSLVFDGRKKIFTDYVELVMYRYTPDARDVIVQVGDGKQEESPLAKHQRFITAVIESINVLTLAPQS